MSKKEPLAWYPWYILLWRSNRKVQRMNVTERGIYRELLDECWLEGSIPANMEDLAEIAGTDVETMTLAWPAIVTSFVERPDGRFVNDRITRVLAAQQEAHQRAVDSGRRGGKARVAKGASRVSKQESRVETTLNGKEEPAEAVPPLPESKRDTETFGARDLRGGPIVELDSGCIPPALAARLVHGRCPKCGEEGGKHTPECIIGRFAATGDRMQFKKDLKSENRE